MIPAPRYVLLAVLLTLVAVAPLPASASDDCDADLEVSLDSSEPYSGKVHYQFKAEVRAKGDCATVYYDLILEIQLPNGHVKRVRVPRQVKVHDYETTQIVTYAMSEDTELVNYEGKIVRCEGCGTF